MYDMNSFIRVEEKIITLREQQILIDRDVAELYGVDTKRVNEAVKNNPDKFPDGYIVSISREDKRELVEIFDRFSPLKHSTVLPTAFTEKGLYMLATILKSDNATQTTIAIVEAFARIRELSATISKLPHTNDEAQQKTLLQRSGEILAELIDESTLEVSGDETTIEINLAVMKIKHTVKRDKRTKSSLDSPVE